MIKIGLLMLQTFFLLAVFILAQSCGSVASSALDGGTVAGNPPDSELRTVTGTVSSSSTSNLSTLVNQATTSCFADSVVATNSRSETSSATVSSDDCSFSLQLRVRKAYRIKLFLNDELVAPMQFDHGRNKRRSSAIIVLSSGDMDIDMGRISLSDSRGRPEREPSRSTDLDDDGIFDFEDEDDDGDGFEDEEEPDCDDDEFPDFFDEEDDCDPDDNEIEFDFDD